MARAADKQEGYSDFGKGVKQSWVRVHAPLNTSLRDGTGLANSPSGLVIDAVTSAGVVTTYWIWIDSTGQLRTSTSEPTNELTSGSQVAPKAITVGTLGAYFGSVAQGSVVEIATTITGIAAGDLILLEDTQVVTSAGTGITYLTVRISAANTAVLKYHNIANVAVTVTSKNLRYFWFDLT